MRPLSRVLLAAVLLIALPGARWLAPPSTLAAPPPLMALRLVVTPGQIAQGRDVLLRVAVRDQRGRPVRALVTVTGAARPLVATAVHGLATLTVRALALGRVVVRASRAGYALARLNVPVVPGAPASVVAIKRGLTVLAPRAKPRPGQVGAELFAAYHALTAARQYASLTLRDGTLVDLNSNTDVLITDPLRQRLNAGELFMEVVHGTASHQVQIGGAVAATRGTRLDVAVNPITKVARVTVIEGLVQVTNGARSVLVGAGQQTTVAAARPPSPPVRVNLAALLAWLANVPNTSRRVVPPVLNLPLPRPITPPAPPIAASPRVTVTAAVSTTTWSGGPYLLQGHVDVPAGATLTIAPGTLLEMAPSAYLSVEGRLLAQGSAAAPIVFTSSRAQPRPGSWYSVALSGAGASGSVLDHVQLFYAGQSNEAALQVSGGASPTISNSAIGQSAAVGLLVAADSRLTVTNCTFSDTGGAPADLVADVVAQFTGAAFSASEGAVVVRGQRLVHSATWPALDVPLRVQGHLDVPAGATLTIAPGTLLQMDPGAYLTAEGALLAQGSAAAPIVFTSSRAQPKAGDWYSVTLSGAGASGSVLDHVQVFYAGQGKEAALQVSGGASPTISNSAIGQSAAVGLLVDGGSRPMVTGCTFSDTGGAPADLVADAVAGFTGAGFDPGEGAVVVRGQRLVHSATWPALDVPLRVQGHLDVPATVSLTLAPGMVLQMDPGAYLTAEGALLAQGSAATPIVFTSSLAQPKAGDWYGVALSGAGASGSVLDHVRVFYAGKGTEAALQVSSGAGPTISNSAFAQNAGVGIMAEGGSQPTIASCRFEGNGAAAISLPRADPGRVHDNTFGPGQRGVQVRG